MPAMSYDEPQAQIIELLKEVEKSTELSNWSPALKAAPEAIAALALCLRASSDQKAKPIDIGKEFNDTISNQVVKFP
jgi:hypothetical protein